MFQKFFDAVENERQSQKLEEKCKLQEIAEKEKAENIKRLKKLFPLFNSCNESDIDNASATWLNIENQTSGTGHNKSALQISNFIFCFYRTSADWVCIVAYRDRDKAYDKIKGNIAINAVNADEKLKGLLIW